MKFLDIVKNRYTTKKYDALKRISAEDVRELQEILRLSPSSINSQPWQFYFVGDGAIKEKLANAAEYNKERILDCSHIVVFTVMDNSTDFEKQIHKHLPEDFIAYFDLVIKARPEEGRLAWMSHQVYLALGYFLSACASMGIDSTPMEGIDPEQYNDILGLKGYKTLFAVAVGYRDKSDHNQPSMRAKERLDFDSVIKNL